METAVKPPDAGGPSQQLRCDAQEIRAALIDAAADGSAIVLRRPFYGEVGLVEIMCANGWRVGCWCDGRQLTHVSHAVAPDRRSWDYGCQREWLGIGSVVDPVQLLTDEQRLQLLLRLLAATSLPLDDVAEGPRFCHRHQSMEDTDG